MHYIFPSKFIFWTKVNRHKELKDLLLPTIKKSLDKTKNAQEKKWLCNVNTEFFSKDKDIEKYISLITDEIYPALDKLFSEIDLKTPKQSTVTEIWYNHYGPNEFQEVHSHVGENSTISGIYILELNEPNKTVFCCPSHISRLVDPAKQTKEIEEGNIILFPADMLHYVLPCQNSRTTIAFNIQCL